MRNKNYPLTISNTSLLSNRTSDPIFLGHVNILSIQITTTGTPNGTFKIQGSNDMGADDTAIKSPSITNWADISGASQAITAAGSIMLNVVDSGYRWARLVWTNSSSGDPSAVSVLRVNIKGF